MRQTTICPMDCPDSCELGVEVVDGRVETIGGGHRHPDTAGFICSKVARFGRRLEHPERLLTPLRRVGPKGEGHFEAFSWAEAMAEIGARFRSIGKRWGSEAIVPFHYGGSNGLLTEGLLDALFFERLGASRLDLTICAVPTTEVARGMYGRMPGVAFEDFVHARCIVIWGANPKASNIHLVPYLKQAKERGAFITVVDPRNQFSDREIDLHLPVRPGTDLALALGMIDWWRREERLDLAFLEEHAAGLDPLLVAAGDWPLERAAEVSGVEAEAIELLADTYSRAHPAVLRCGWGLERNRNGGQAVAAVLAMPTLLGKFGERGGGYLMSNGGAKRFDRQRVIGRLDGSRRRSLNMSQLGRWLGSALDPPVKALFVYNANPVATVPDQNAVVAGLSREDLFTVVSEQVMTDTAVYADIVLPAVTFLEGWDLRAGYGSYVAGGVRPVVEALGERRTNQQLFRDLAAEMGFDDPAFDWSEEQLFEKVAQNLTLGERSADATNLLEGGIEQHEFPVPGPIQFRSVWPQTPDGRVHLTPEVLGPHPYELLPADEAYPLALISPASRDLISSTMGEYNYDRLWVELNPLDAGPRGIESGDRVRVFNALGAVVCAARVSPRIRDGVVSMPKGAWRRASDNGSTSTALCPDHVNTVGGAACFNDARVEIEKIQ